MVLGHDTECRTTPVRGKVWGSRSGGTAQFGNVLAATAFLQGLSFEEIDRARLDIVDPLYPVITVIRATKS